MFYSIPSHYSPLIPPVKVTLKILLIDLLDMLFMEEEDDFPDEPFHVYFSIEEEETWCVAERIGGVVALRYKGKVVKVSYAGAALIMVFNHERHIVTDTDDLIIDCDIVRNVLTETITSDNIATYIQPSEDESHLINELLNRSSEK